MKHYTILGFIFKIPLAAGVLLCAGAWAQADTGTLNADITDAAGKPLHSRITAIELESATRHLLEVEAGVGEWPLPPGNYRTYVEVYERGVPVLVESKDLTLEPGGSAYVLVNLLEWGGETLTLRDFDYDGDLAIDRVELASGTDPNDASSVPGRPMLTLPSPVLAGGARWYRGELFAQSELGEGNESVKKLIARAEKERMDFLAIADRGHMKSLDDPDYKSDKVVLIPAMQWGTDERGWALLYAPRTLPDPPTTVPMAQAECIRVQAQGGIFAVAHPCVPTSPWKWGLGYVNAVQVWHRGWRDLPPLNMANLPEELRKREDGRPVFSIAAAAAASDLDTIGANAQASLFWDYELVRGLIACPIAGTGSASPKVPMGSPITYIYAREKSLAGLLEGLRLGRTYVSSGPDGPQLAFRADIGADGSIEIGMGGIVPLNVDAAYEVGVRGATGKKLQVLVNGYPLFTKVIESESYAHKFNYTAKSECALRARVISGSEDPKEGFGRLDVHAMSSPIYAQDMAREAIAYFGIDPDKAWISVGNEYSSPTEADLPAPEEAQTLPIDFRNSFGRYNQMQPQGGNRPAAQPVPAQQQQEPDKKSRREKREERGGKR